jgi:hypothetical protein
MTIFLKELQRVLSSRKFDTLKVKAVSLKYVSCISLDSIYFTFLHLILSFCYFIDFDFPMSSLKAFSIH